MKNQIKFSIPFYESFRCNKIATTFDLEVGQTRVKTIEYDTPPSAEDDWLIGVIVGPSGAGKSSVIAKHYGNDVYTSSGWDARPIIENFDKSLSFEQITGTLTAVGFSSIPCWLQPYATLSNGERFRCDLARALLQTDKKLVVFDEFSSVVDRTVAKTASLAISKAIKKKGLISKKFIAVTCHYDVLPWIDPDWILDMRTGTLEKVRLRRPNLIVKIYETGSELWPVFSKYHYLTSDLLRTARCYVAFVDDQPAAFRATIHSMGHQGARRGHRLVVLPEFQGIGPGRVWRQRLQSMRLRR